MIKKIAILAIVMMIFIGGNLLASQEDPIRLWVWAQDELTWTLKVEGQTPKTKTGDWYTTQWYWGCLDWEIWVFGEKILDGTFPMSGDVEITIPISIPSNEDPEQ